MKKKDQITCEINCGLGSIELVCDVSFEYYPYEPASPPTFDRGWLPSVESRVDDIEVLRAYIYGDREKKHINLPDWLAEFIASCISKEGLLEACEDEDPDYD